MSKAIKKVIGVAAAVAVPFVAPAIASSIGVSTAIGSALGSATAGSVIGSALTGAALGAATGAITGQNVGRSALMGAIGGGLGGYFNAPTAAAPSAATTASPGLALPSASVGAPSGLGLQAPADFSFASAGTSSPYSLTASVSPGLGLQAPAGFSFVPSSSPYSLASGASSGLGLDASANYGFMADTSIPSGGLKVATAPSFSSPNIPSPTTNPPSFMETLKKVPSAIADRFKDPNVMADMTLRAAGLLAGSALAGDGLTPEQRALLNKQAEELRYLQQTNQELFQQRLQQAMNLIGEAKYFDPEYFGLQSARRAQVAGARAKAAGLRGLEGNARLAEARRYDLATSRDVGTAFDVGYNTGVQGRLNTLTAGINAMPAGYQAVSYEPLYNIYSKAEDARAERAKKIGTLFGSITGRSEA